MYRVLVVLVAVLIHLAAHKARFIASRVDAAANWEMVNGDELLFNRVFSVDE